MTQPEQAVGGASDTVVAAEPTIEDRFAVLADQEPEEEEPEEGPVEDQPEILPEEDEPEVEADDVPPIKPPASWNTEEQEEFKQLPRALQETLTRRESERERFVQSKSQEAKQAGLAAQQQLVEQVTQAQGHYLQTLQSVLPELPEKPPAHLMATDPALYAQLMENHENALAWHVHAQEQAQSIQQQQQAARQQLLQHELQATQERLQSDFPEYLDPAQGPELRTKLGSTALALGYSQDQLAQVNAQDILAIRTATSWKDKADKYDALMAKQMDKVRAAKSLPRVSRPGSSPQKGAVANERYTADRKAMQQGDKDAANRVFSRFL